MPFDLTETQSSIEHSGELSKPAGVEDGETTSPQKEATVSSKTDTDSLVKEHPHVTVSVNGEDEVDMTHSSNNDVPSPLAASNGQTSSSEAQETTTNGNQSNVSHLGVVTLIRVLAEILVRNPNTCIDMVPGMRHVY